MEELKPLRGVRGARQASQLSKFPRTYVKNNTETVLRSRRRISPEFGPDRLENRAAQGFYGTLPERIVYKKLSEMLLGTHNFTFQRLGGGGRNYIGGFVLDFVVIDRVPNVVIEILGDYWHQAYEKQADLERQMAVVKEGYLYNEIWESEIYISDENLENKLNVILEGRI
tara:strand:- start:8 stop:517 length:510 start_codon:yes stop_codon:yes gene_type:complete